MTYSEIEAFLTVVNFNSFSAASNALFITQPALSRKIGYLEKELGYTLFVRSKGNHNIYLTPEGNEFIHIARELKRLMEISKSLSSTSSKKLDLVMAYPFFSVIWSEIIDKFLTDIPDNRFSVTHTSVSSAYSMVENGTIDLAITVTPQFSSLAETIPLVEQKLYVLSKNKLTNKKSISTSELNLENELYIPLSGEYIAWHEAKFGVSALPRVTIDQRDMLDKYLVKDDAWLFAPYFLKEYIVSKYNYNVYEIEDIPPAVTVYAVKSKYNKNPLTDVFIEHVKTQMPENADGIKIL